MIVDKNIPSHIAIIMDGNGRWAKDKGLNRIRGHEKGVRSVQNIIRYSSRIGIKYLTLFTFSEENWNRPKAEVLALMKLLVHSLKKELDDLMKNNIKFKVIGDLNKLDSITQTEVKAAQNLTISNTGLNLNLAISYGGRHEIVNACNKIIKHKKEFITVDEFSNFLYTSGMPDPDLLIRTAGENRISNFLLWQIAYTEIYVSQLYWPDFDENELENALQDYNLRERKFGRVSRDV
ncbi:MAG: isoprenyl transferase [Candidatus Marinimicrobia bacterium]|nr:isoprenyl transferase [Candidatus Neomarinimicrobiota bacterium]|tara:strand:- start:12933 stop:13637 length:705 start_codon:yes stop_codon:yes gene_type:complete